MIANPILRKEVLSALRTRKAFLMQALFLLMTAVLLWRYWPADGLQDIGSQQSRRIFSILAMGQLALVAMFAPAFTAAAITSEREKRTMESLFATLLRPWEIVIGKMAGSLIFIVMLVLTGVPALAAPFLLGGVSGATLLSAVGVLLLTAVYLGTIGLLVSTHMHRSYRAIIVTYVVLIFVCFVFALPAWPVTKNLILQGGPIWQAVLHTVVSLSPLEAMLSVVMGNSSYAIGAANMPPFHVTFVPVALVVITVCVSICLAKLHRPIAPPRPREGMKVVERDGKITVRSFVFLIDPRKRKRMIAWWQNPVLMKEFRTRPMLQTQWLLRACGICLISSIVLMLIVAISIQTWIAESTGMFNQMLTAVAALILTLIMLVGPAMTSGAICSDRESGVWDLIRATRISSLRLASGKFQASIIPLLMLAASMAPAMIVLLYFDMNLLSGILRVLSVVGLTVLFVATAGTLFSSIFAKSSTATAWTYALMIAMGLASLLVVLDPEGFSQRFVRGAFLINPVAAGMAAAGAQGLARFNLIDPHMKIVGAVTAGMFIITVMRIIHLRRPR
ncbi:MAG: ABC transporter permease [Planctomycetes bacterium]|jgi:ABC-type transport system involved in multi-copper enzyme maturation permease subunit|nr:ABC transporter permease [Planctomycetota bacterium]